MGKKRQAKEIKNKSLNYIKLSLLMEDKIHYTENLRKSTENYVEELSSGKMSHTK
jgi:hypothetical protein